MCTERTIYNRICRLKRMENNRREAIKLLTTSKRNPRSFWRDIKNKNKNSLPNIDFFNHFKNLAETESNLGNEGREEVETIEEASTITNIYQLDKPFTKTELDSTISKTKNNKSAGTDNILNEFISNSSNEVKDIILRIFNTLLKLEYFPDIWAKGLITPVFKKGNRNNTNNYRGITVLSLLGKIYTRLISERLTTWAERNNIFTESQFGFRKSRNTTDCIFVIKGLIDILFSQGKKLYVCFIDYTKAFDLLNRSAIFAKLFRSGVSTKLINIFKNMYSKMKLGVKNDVLKQEFASNVGLLQGEICSPAIFSLFMNDLPDYLSDNDVGVQVVDLLLKVLMFADDMAIFSTTEDGLQIGLNQLSSYCAKWGISVNTEKTKIVIFKRGGKTSDSEKWTFNGKEIEVVSVFKYLGCLLSSSGSFKNHIDNAVDSARRGLFGLNQYISTNPEILPSQQLELFHTMIEPIMTYSCEVWGLNNCSQIETFYLSFLKTMLYVKKSTPNCYIYGELGVFPIQIKIKLRVIKYWLKLIRPTTSQDNFNRKVYIQLLLVNIFNPQQVTWVSQVKDMLNSMGMGYIWNIQKVENENEFLKSFKLRLKDMYKQQWNSEISNTTDGRLYKNIKHDFEFENYLQLPKYLRTSISKIRMSSHLFYIERGRWSNIDRQHRTCELCNKIEDEYHIFIECPRFNAEQEKYLPKYLKEHPNIFNFMEFLKTKDKTESKKLGLMSFTIQKKYRKNLMA